MHSQICPQTLLLIGLLTSVLPSVVTDPDSPCTCSVPGRGSYTYESGASPLPEPTGASCPLKKEGWPGTRLP